MYGIIIKCIGRLKMSPPKLCRPHTPLLLLAVSLDWRNKIAIGIHDYIIIILEINITAVMMGS